MLFLIAVCRGWNQDTVLGELLCLESFMCVSHKNQVCYTSGEVLCVHLQVPCVFSHSSQCRLWGCCLQGLSGCCESEFTVHAPRDCHLLPSRARDSPGRNIMLLWYCSTTHLVSGGITTTYISCTLKIEMAFFILPRKFMKMLFYHTHAKDSINKFLLLVVRFHPSMVLFCGAIPDAFKES